MGAIYFILYGILTYANVSLDTHIHHQTKGFFNPMMKSVRAINQNDVYHYIQGLVSSQNPAEKFFYISEGYVADSLVDMNLKNQNVLNLAARYPRMLPICGIDLDFVEQNGALDICLDSDRTVGFKVHLYAAGDGLSTPNILNSLLAALEKIKGKKYYLLIHLHFPKDREQEEARLFLEITKQYPKINFVIAHAATNYPEILLDAKDLDNVFTETSTIFSSFKGDTSYYGYTKKDLANIFRIFGMRKVFYGSDTFITHPLNPKYISDIQNFPEFTEAEKEQILVSNGRRLLQSL